MNESKSYNFQEDAPQLVADSVTAHSWVFLSNLSKQPKSSIQRKMFQRLDELALLQKGWDGEGSCAISQGILEFVRRTIMMAKDVNVKYSYDKLDDKNFTELIGGSSWIGLLIKLAD